MKASAQRLTRRQFLEQSLRQASLALAAGAAVALSERFARAGEPQKPSNPFAYDVEKVSKTDPQLIRYEEIGHFTCPEPDPRRLAVGPKDRLYVAAKNGLIALDSQGAVLSRFSTSTPARCVAVANDGTLYAGLRDQIAVFDPKGRLLATWEAPDPKTWFTGLTVGKSELFAADAANRVVLHFDKSGKLLGRLGQKNADHNVPGLIVPSPYLDVKLGRDGLLRVNNPGRHCVETYTAQGDLELSWGKPTAAIQGFCGCCNPVGLAPLPDGRWVTCEKGLPRVKVYSATGAFECVVAGPETFPRNAQTTALTDPSDGAMGGLDAAADSRGRLYVLDRIGGGIHLFQPKAA
jgi:hypothetical protein